MKFKLTGIHGTMIMVAITIIIAISVVYVVNECNKEYSSITASDINNYVGKKVNVKFTPIQEIELVPEVEGIHYVCEESNVVVSSTKSLELDKTISVRGEVKEHGNGFVLFAE